MNRVKKLLVVMMMLCMVVALCACGNAAEEETPNVPTAAPETVATEAPETEAVEETAAADDGMTEYTITVVDDAGNPVVGAMVQMCKDSCLPGPATDAEGKTRFSLPEDDYKVSFIVVPAGYTYADEVTEFYFEDGATELTITLKADA